MKRTKRIGFSYLGAGLGILSLTSCVSPLAPVPVPAPPVADRGEIPQPGPASFALSGPAQQGSIMRGQAPFGTRELRFNGTVIPFDKDRRFLIAFDRDAENAATLQAVLSDGRVIDHYLPVRPGQWRIEHVDASPTGGVTTEEFRARRAGELARINAARSMLVNSDGWRQQFIWPVRARISGLFGSQRIYRGSPGSYHSGVDIAAAAGTAFVAPADGVVILAAQTPFTLEGRLLMIDHGMGLNSAFLHCSRLDVQEGDVVHQGQILGAVGATGRASGPHLHWGMKWHMARIDPMLLPGAM